MTAPDLAAAGTGTVSSGATAVTPAPFPSPPRGDGAGPQPAAGQASEVDHPSLSGGQDSPRVVGLDPSLTGFGIASSAGWTDKVGVDGLTVLPLAERSGALRELAAAVLTLVGDADLVVIEMPAYSRTGGGTSERGSLWWRVVDGLLDREIPIATCMANTRIRYALGKGVGSKGAVIDQVARRFPHYQTGGDDNLADAVVLMAMGRDRLGAPIADLPKTHRAALDAVTWPDLHSPTRSTGATP